MKGRGWQHPLFDLMKEVKTLEIPRFKSILPGDVDMLKTLDSFKTEQWYEIFIPSNKETDMRVTLADGSITRVAACPSINGVQWIIPANTKVKVPKTIYELMIASPEQRNMVANKIACPTVGYGHSLGTV